MERPIGTIGKIPVSVSAFNPLYRQSSHKPRDPKRTTGEHGAAALARALHVILPTALIAVRSKGRIGVFPTAPSPFEQLPV